MINTSKNPRYITTIGQVNNLSQQQKQELRPVIEKFTFRANDYYLSLIDWDDPADPIRQIIIPEAQELEEFGLWDASDEASYMVVKGLEHKYPDTALLLVNNVCGGYCRFCFRKRLFTEENDEVTNDLTEAMHYIRIHPEINNVLLSGGDPLVMSTAKLEKIIRQIREIDHVKIVRIGSKIPAFNPFRVINDPSLLEMVAKYSVPGRKIYVMLHFNHPRELTQVALEAITLLQKAGATLVNQSPMIRGVNDNPAAISELFSCLSFNGVPSYYIFICRPTAGNKAFLVPVEKSLEILERARLNLSGLAKHARLCMSHKTGKVEVLGKTGTHVIFRYHRAADPLKRGKIMIFRSNPQACWLDDYCSEELNVVERRELAPVRRAAV